MRTGRLTAFAAALLLLVPLARASEEGPVWFWYSTCGGPTMVIEVRLDKQLLYKTAVPLCLAPRDDSRTQRETHPVVVRFTPSRAIEWSGYRDQPDVTRPGQELELTLWQAGADPDDLQIGVSVAGDEMLYMNTIHIAHPKKRAESAIASGLVVVTYPRAAGTIAAKP
jgi:hypothetical protein